MTPLRQLFSQTALYGMSGIIGRVLNYLLVPLYTRVFTTEQYGIVTEMYAYVSFLIILLTYGMETAFFRFYSIEENREKVYNTALLSVFTSSLLFIVFSTLFATPIADFLRYPHHSEYVVWFAIIVSLDALSAIPLARLRALNSINKFAAINFSIILLNIGLNLFFLLYCKSHYEAYRENSNWIVTTLYNPDIGVGYVFISNLIASIVKTIFLIPQMSSLKPDFDFTPWKKMMRYALPLLIAGIAGIANENIDRIMLKHILIHAGDEKYALEQVGIYGACYKVSIIISLFIQAFRFAADPFFFTQHKHKDAKQIYSDVMSYFVIACLFLFTVIMLFMNQVMLLVGKEFRVGIHIVPILLLANVCLGIYYNLSIWFKLNGKTEWGAYISILGAVITLLFNYYWIPVYGYMGSAWATLLCYGTMMIVSYFFGRKYYPIPYNLVKISGYFILAIVLIGISRLCETIPVNNIASGILLLAIYVFVFFAFEKKHLLTSPLQ